MAESGAFADARVELLDGHARHCLMGEDGSSVEQADELMGAVGRLMRRG
jgi:hypothetical protein